MNNLCLRNKANVATRNMAMSRQKKLDKMDKIELAAEKPKPEFYFKEARTPSRVIFSTKDLVIGYDKDELKRALKEYNGSILMVCHEPEFYEGLATDVWDVSQWTTKIM